ncbi:hypothetical protein D9758_015085 [Tetrapyrgos nigripes]|uniref:Uncharacterized protein n=1 Tax=Tetrapyrgos nigripes TaxID=182062 RepID=A0A8H5C7N8_9AGAR|nr:hypothetical protein D9758_015085 [Tetrapyrgos nigripes]
MSSPASPLQTTAPKRRLSARRGSISAPDPFAKHADLNRSLSSSSTLTIVRVLGNNNNNHSDAFALQEPPSSHSSSRRLGSQHQQHRRTGSNSSDSGSGRLSFAFSSFGGPQRSTSPTSQRRPASPGRHHALPQSQPRLSPEQLYDLAHQATNPKYFPSPGDASSPSPYRPESPHRPVSPSYFRRSPVLNAVNPSPATAPATFTPLPPSIFLPFMDRPSEVAALISSSPTKKLFALLRQTFPRDPSLPGVNSDNYSSSPQFPPLQTQITGTPIPRDPATWTYPQLMTFLTTTTRSDMPDTLWVAKIRKCILSRSELIWERVKGALGVPPELDIDANFLEDTEMHGDVFESSSGSEDEGEHEAEKRIMSRRPANVRTETDEMEDFGRKARGHWDDWDAVLSSPDVERAKTQPQFPDTSKVSTPVVDDPEILTAVAPTPRQQTSPGEKSSDLPLITEQVPTPFDEAFPPPGHTKDSKSVSSLALNPLDLDMVSGPIGSPSGASESHLIIEPLLSPSASKSPVPSANPPPLSLPSSLALEAQSGSTGALGDIIEGEEEEEEDEKGAAEQEDEDKKKDEDTPSDDSKSEPAIDPSQIHGLRISLPGTPVTPSASWRDVLFAQTQSNSSPVSSPVDSNMGRRPLSIGSSSGVAGLTRTGSTGSIRSLGSVGSRKHPYMNPSGYGEGRHFTTSSDGGYESDGVGNFARLATGPTLAANNPSLRSPPVPPASKYNPLYHSSSLRARFDRRGSKGSASGTSDYAITFGSSSVGDN